MQRVGFIVMEGFQIMCFAAASVFEFANLSIGKPRYDVHVLSEHGGPIRCSLGLSMDTERFRSSAFDTLIVGGCPEIVESSPTLIAFVRRSVKSVRRIASVWTGAFVLAEAGILDGRRVATHWLNGRELQRRFPTVKVKEDRIFIVDGPVWTSAGMSGGIDLALGMVERDLGADVARLVAKKLILHHRRAAGQSQHSALLDLDPKSDRIQRVLAYAAKNLRAPLSVNELAHQAHLSPRQFSRAFRAETGKSPAKAVEDLRLEAARLMVEQGNDSIEVIADECGFANPERMRRAFLRAFSQPPQVIRRNARIADLA